MFADFLVTIQDQCNGPLRDFIRQKDLMRAEKATTTRETGETETPVEEAAHKRSLESNESEESQQNSEESSNKRPQRNKRHFNTFTVTENTDTD